MSPTEALKHLKILKTAEEISLRIEELGNTISTDYGDEEVIVLCVLRGGFIFAADLVRRLRNPVKIDFITLSSYGSGTISKGVVDLKTNIRENIKDKNVLVIEDIVDTGQTLDFLIKHLESLGPRSIRLASLLSKPSCRKVDVHIDYLGFEIKDLFVVGYGLDHDGKYRQLPCIGYIQ